MLFQVGSLSPPLLFDLVDFYHVHSPAGYFSVFSSCLYCCVWGALSTGLKFMVPLNCAWFLLIVESATYGWGWTSGLSRFPVWRNLCLFWWVELDLFSLECNEVSSSEFSMALGSLPFNVQGCISVLLEN